MNINETETEQAAALEPLLANCRAYWLGWGTPESASESPSASASESASESLSGGDHGELTYYRTGLADGQLNGVLRLTGTDELEQVVSYATDRMAGLPWMWWVGPDSAPDTARRLTEHGAVKLGASPVMAIRLDRLAPAPGPADLKIETVEDAEALYEWVEAFTTAFGVTPDIIDDVARLEAERPDSPRITRFAGRRDGRIVGTSLLYEAHGIAGLYVVSTDPDHRRQGIGTALSTAALTAGRERGLTVGTLQSSPLGALVYPHMGFETVAEYGLFGFPAS
ncbi:GNAT family N-acetyltransferase [Streptomyces sp. NPDC004610]|uniref:GNAT family N-acetyltransferase n=1 Tax=unclassified Streptomyces TaxID=2593676 RepID=UPI0033AE211E